MTIVVEGETIRRWFDLGTTDKVVARRRMERLAESQSASPDALMTEAKRPETYREAAKRIRAARRAEGLRDVLNEEIRDRLYLNPVLGDLLVTEIRPSHVTGVLEEAARRGRLCPSEEGSKYKPRPASHNSLVHIRAAANVVFDRLWRDEAIADNPVARVRIPKVRRDRRERAVLTDAELALYLAWEHPSPKRRVAVLERQVMAIVARTFGGLRTGDLHALTWNMFDVEHGQFEWGLAPRKKTARPQRLEVPDLLRPFMRLWWELQGCPMSGSVFPVLRGRRAGEGKTGGSHARALRRDLQRSFKAAGEQKVEGIPEPDSVRWHELFDETAHTRPVDFHSFRRAYAQALADADVSAQQAAGLAGHADLGAHMVYLANTSKARRLPARALPDLRVVKSSAARPIQLLPQPRVDRSLN